MAATRIILTVLMPGGGDGSAWPAPLCSAIWNCTAAGCAASTAAGDAQNGGGELVAIRWSVPVPRLESRVETRQKKSKNDHQAGDSPDINAKSFRPEWPAAAS